MNKKLLFILFSVLIISQYLIIECNASGHPTKKKEIKDDLIMRRYNYGIWNRIGKRHQMSQQQKIKDGMWNRIG